jgi:Werner syndrome ATP-dependent helicase
MNSRKIQYNNTLKKSFGYDALKPEQFAIIEQIVEFNRDVCAVLATGFGKSLCFQMPFLLTKKNVIIISPLIALMEDQKTQMEALDIPVCSLNNTCKDKTRVKNEILAGENKLIYITPEYLLHCEGFLKELAEQDSLALICIDESHCVSMWSSFRPSYAKLDVIRDWIPDIPILAVTATASDKVRQDIFQVLKLKKPHIVIGNFDRPNLYISITKKEAGNNAEADIAELLKKHEGEYIIIYCKTKAHTESIAKLIDEMGIACGAYHAGMDNTTRSEVQQKFISGEIKCIVATIAFGMGINISNVRLVIHYGCPKNLESYYQEIGRAGRDGEQSDCHLIFSNKDFLLNRFFAKQIKEIKFRTYEEDQIRVIEKYVHTLECRRKVLLKHFGSVDASGNPITSCTNCDNCTSKVKTIKTDCTWPAYLILSLIKSLDGKYGATMYINILKGSNAKTMNTYVKSMSQYDQGSEYPTDWWKTFVRDLINLGYLQEKQSSGRFCGSILMHTKQTLSWLISMQKYKNISKTTVINDINKIYIESKEKTKKKAVKKEEPEDDIDIKMKIMQEEVDTDNFKITIGGNNGKRWTEDEETKLLKNLKNKSIPELAIEHKRTEGGIKSRLKEIAYKLHTEGKTIKEISKTVKISESDLDKIIEKKGLGKKIVDYTGDKKYTNNDNDDNGPDDDDHVIITKEYI